MFNSRNAHLSKSFQASTRIRRCICHTGRIWLAWESHRACHSHSDLHTLQHSVKTRELTKEKSHSSNHATTAQYSGVDTLSWREARGRWRIAPIILTPADSARENVTMSATTTLVVTYAHGLIRQKPISAPAAVLGDVTFRRTPRRSAVAA